MNKKVLWLVGAILAVSGATFVYSQYGASLFTATTSVATRVPQFTITNLTNPQRKTSFQVGDTLRLAVHWSRNLSVQVCTTFQRVTKCEKGNPLKTDASGNWSATVQVPTTAAGAWIRWVTVGGVASNKISYTVISSDALGAHVDAPNGGGVWFVGGSGSIAWTLSGNYPAGTKQSVYLYKGGQNYFGPALSVSDVAGAKGSFTWKIQNTIPAGNDYQIKLIISDSAGRTLASDISDAVFMIGTSYP